MDFNPNRKPDTKLLFLKGPVKQVMEICYQAHKMGQTIVPGPIERHFSFNRFNSVTSFNQQGYRTHEMLYGDGDGQENFFNEKNEWTKAIHYGKEGKVKYTSFVEYDERGNRVKDTSVYPDGSIYVVGEYYWDESNKIIKHFSFKGNERQQTSHVVHEYNDQQQETCITQYEADGSWKHKSIYTYNDKGQKIQYHTELANPGKYDRVQKHTYEYNEQGDMIRSNIYDHEGNIKTTHTYTHEYDSHGKRINKPHVWNPHELEDGETEKNEEDAYGNWIKKTVIHRKGPPTIFVRQIAYYGDASEQQPPFVHPITTASETVKAPEREDIPDSPELSEFTPKQANWLGEWPQATGDNFSALRFYTLRFNEHPTLIDFQGPAIEAIALKKYLTNRWEAIEVHSYETVSRRSKAVLRYTLTFRDKPYVLQAYQISRGDPNEYVVSSFVEKMLEGKSTIYTSPIHFLGPSDASGRRDRDFEMMIKDAMDTCGLEEKPEKPHIQIIEVNSNGFVMSQKPVNDNFQITDLDIHYGAGFANFHNELMKRFQTQSKGLVLFHGQPGTGKTYYIRHLLRAMAADKRKNVVYMPPNMVDHLTDPAFMTFLAKQIRHWTSRRIFSVLLIEDAEPLLAKRQAGVRIQGVTNLLNMSDGLLNDMMSLQIICTFNVDIKKLDSALLRPGRLVARKEFVPLGVLDANLLAQRLGIKHRFTQPASLAEIYALRQDQDTLIHDVDFDQDTSTTIDDLLN